ncbi:MAG: acetate--CoA ligase family protein, partial [Halobacteriota archaeon]
PEYAVCSTPAEAVEAAEAIGYPVVVKVSSPSIAHKSEWAAGAGIHLDCTGPAAVREAAETIRRAASDRGLDYEILLEASIDTDDGVETIVGGTDNPTFGPTVLFGLGGTHAELIDDVTYRLGPIDVETATEMTTELRGSDLLDGYRGGPVVDRTALARTVAAIGDVLAEREAIAEIEVNPLLATADDAVALDALIVLNAE